VFDSYRARKPQIAAAREHALRSAEARRRFLLGPDRDARWAAASREARRESAAQAIRQALVRVAEVDLSERRTPLPLAHRLLFELAETGIDLGPGVPAGDAVRARARRLLGGLKALEDPVWGGLFRFSRCSDWRCPEREKLLSTQAAAIEDGAR